MRILVLYGSPHPNGMTADMVSTFEKGAKEAGHEVISPKRNGRSCTNLEKPWKEKTHNEANY